MSGGALLPPGSRLLRVLRDKPLHVVPGRREPTPAAFEPSSADLGVTPVRVSVWDADRVSLSRVCELRGGGDFAGFVLRAEDVARVAVERSQPRLRAVTDPDGAGEVPEAPWHYGIEGLEKSAWSDKVERNKALLALARSCTPAS